MNNNALKEIAVILTKDAEFGFRNGKEHYYKRKNRKDIPNDMSLNQYLKISKKVSLKNIDGKNVRAYKKDKRTIKCDGGWLVIYQGGKNGTLITSYPATMSVFETKMKSSGGVEIFTE